MSVALILPAAGTGKRLGADKLWVEVAGRPLLWHTLGAAAAYGGFSDVVVVTPEARWDLATELAASHGLSLTLTPGGERRQQSVLRGLEATSAEYVCVHDAARPFCSAALFGAVVDAARMYGSSTAVVPVVDTIKRVEDSTVVETLARDVLYNTQTPQAFSRELLLSAHRAAADEHFEADDDAGLVERLGVAVRAVIGDARNYKVTRPDDLLLAERILAQRPIGNLTPS